MSRLQRALGAITITGLVMTGWGLAGSPAQARPTASACGVLSTLTALTAPVIGGTGVTDGSDEAGEALRVTAMPTWSCAPASTSIQWYRGLTAISGQTGDSYVPTTHDVGSVVTAVVTAHVLGLVPVPVTSNPISVVGSDGGTPVDAVLRLAGGLELPTTGAVGEALTPTGPVWSLPGVATSYRWLRDGSPIAGGRTYVPTLDDAGHLLEVAATGTVAGVLPVTALSNAVSIPVVVDPQLSFTDGVSLAGHRKIGTDLTASGPRWVLPGVTTTYRWLRDGSPIAGAEGTTYRLRSADYGHAIASMATGLRVGSTAATVVSASVAPLAGDPLTPTTAPRIAGIRAVGRVLTVDPGAWTGAERGDSTRPAYSYQWRRDGRAIDGAVAQTYQVRRSDAGHRLTATVGATRPGYHPGRATTAAALVPKLASTLSATLARKVVTTRQRAAVALYLRVARVGSPTGVLRVRDGRSVIATGRVAAGRSGRATVRLPRLAAGVHRLRAEYAGSGSIAAARSKVLRLTVRR